jgi:hypothetical protein
MGLEDQLKNAVGAGGVSESNAEPGDHYDAKVNKKSLNMAMFTRVMNQRWRHGWKLSNAFEQDGNTVMVWERRI